MAGIGSALQGFFGQGGMSPTPMPPPMLPTMGNAIRGMFGGGGASITPRPTTIGGAIGGMAPMLGGGGGHVVGAWGQAHPEILAQRKAARQAARGGY